MGFFEGYVLNSLGRWLDPESEHHKIFVESIMNKNEERSGDGLFYYNYFNNWFQIGDYEYRFKTKYEQFIQPPEFEDDIRKKGDYDYFQTYEDSKKEFKNDKYIIEAMRLFEEKRERFSDFEIFGFIDKDFGKDSLEINKLKYLGITKYHDREMNIIRVFFKEIVDCISKAKSLSKNGVVEVLSNIFEVTINQGFMEEASFTIEKENDASNNLIKALINNFHTEIKKRSRHSAITSAELYNFFNEKIELLTNKFDMEQLIIDHFKDLYLSKKKSINRNRINELINSFLDNTIDEKEIELFEEFFVLTNGHIFLNQFIKNGLVISKEQVGQKITEEDIIKSIEKEIMYKNDSIKIYSLLCNIDPLDKYFDYRLNKMVEKTYKRRCKQ